MPSSNPPVAVLPNSPGSAPTTPTAAGGVESWALEPFLHLGDGKVYNPLTDKTLDRGDAGWPAVEALLEGRYEVDGLEPEDRDKLIADGWVVSSQRDLARRYWLKYVSIETHTVCNQSCYFCPVSVAPRKAYFMETELFERLVRELQAYRESLEGVWLMNYNEPTVDKRFVEQCRTLVEAGLAVGVNSNGSGLTPDKIDALVEMGPLRYLSINLSTVDREKYHRDRGKDQLDLVLRNLDYANGRPVADEMVMMVLGTGDEQHQRDHEAITQRFGRGFEVKYAEIMDRAGHIEVGHRPLDREQSLCGCENVGSRPLQHLHVLPDGKCVLCCEDYDENYVVGDLRESTVHDVLTSDRVALLRRWAYGLDQAPDDFICKGCVFALRR